MKIFVFGWYGQNNLGDEVFKVCLRQLWPTATLIFGNSIPLGINTKYDALWIGGGSFLDQPIVNIDTVTIPIYFIGVGVSATLPECNQRALQRAKMVVCRDGKSFGNTPNKENTYLTSDLVFARTDLKPLGLEKTKQITIILNDFLTPVGGAVPDWRSLSYYWFLQEFTKIIDRYAIQDYKIKLIPMCINPRIDDRRIAAAIQGRASYPHRYEWILNPLSELELRTEISKSAFVITQRFHGLIYSVLEQSPCLTLCTHDKFNSLVSELNLPSLDYYGLTDIRFREAIDKVSKMPFDYSSYIEAARMAWEPIRKKVMPD